METKYLLKTEDGTSTLFLEEYGQAMHSISGAYEESLLKHVIPSKILSHENENVNVLDIGFGLGYNVLALMTEYINNQTGSLTIISLEKEKCFHEFMATIKFNDLRDDIYDFIKGVYLSGEGTYNGIKLQIIFGDAREAIKSLTGKFFHAIFQDPFSPSKNPELWSIDYFIKLRELLTDTGIITTYSSADHIRRAMIEAGLQIGRGPSVGKKREGTLAGKTGSFLILNNEELNKIINNIKSVPYEDSELSLSREIILNNRLLKIKTVKNMIK